MAVVAHQSDGRILEVRGLTKRFEGVVAVQDLDLTLEEGEIRGLIGPNGSGKTTFINLVSGLLPPSNGRISFQGRDITGLKPHLVARLGIARTFQIPKILPELTCLENVMLGCHARHGFDLWGTWLRPPLTRSRQEEEIREKALEILDLVGLKEVAPRPGTDLSWMEEQLLQIGRALLSRPKVLLLDEPTAGMGEAESKTVEGVVRRIQAQGVTTLVVAHDMNLIGRLAENLTCISFGLKISEGTCRMVLEDPDVHEVYLGAE